MAAIVMWDKDRWNGTYNKAYHIMLMEMVRKRLYNPFKTVGFNSKFIIINYRSRFFAHVDLAPFRVLF